MVASVLAREHGLSMYIGKEKQCPLVLATARELLQRVQAGRIDRWYIAHPDNEHFRLLCDLTQCVFELLGRTKEKRTVLMGQCRRMFGR